MSVSVGLVDEVFGIDAGPSHVEKHRMVKERKRESESYWLARTPEPRQVCG